MPDIFTDSELLQIYHNPKADLAKLSRAELQRLDTLTTPTLAPAQERMLGKAPQTGPDGPPAEPSGLMSVMAQAAHPGIDLSTGAQKGRLETAGDLVGLTLPNAALGDVTAVGGRAGYLRDLASRTGSALKTAGKETTSATKAMSMPLRAISKFREALPSQMAEDVAAFKGPAEAPAPLPTQTVNQIPRDTLYDTWKASEQPQKPTLAQLVEKARQPGGTLSRLRSIDEPARIAPRPIPSTDIAPMASHAQTAPKLEPETGVQVAPLNAAEAPVSQPLGTPRILTRKATPTSWTPEAARARIEMNDWHSGAEPGTPEAAQASALHRETGAMDSRLKFLLDNPKASVLLGLSPLAARQALLTLLASSDEP